MISDKGDTRVRIYLHGDKPTKQPAFRFTVCPGLSGLIAEDDLPSEWKDGDRPREFALTFKFGEAECDDQLARWMLKHGMCHDRPGAAPKLDLKKIIRGWL
jgi:hypothetical protein